MENKEPKTDTHSAFESIRPLCVQLTKEQTVENVQNLQKKLMSIEVSALQDLLDYVLFPLKFSLQTPAPRKNDLTQGILHCMSYLFSKTRLKSSATLKEMFDDIFSCLPPDPQKTPVPEELKLAVVMAVHSLLQSSGENVLPVLYKPSSLPAVGYSITILLKLAELEKSREIRLESMKCLSRLLFPEVKVESSLGDLFASFLPGVCTTLNRIICGDSKQGYRVTTAAVKLWAGIVSLVMSDESISKVPLKKPHYSSLPTRVSDLLVHRDTLWVKTSATHLLTQLEKIVVHCNLELHWKVRLAVVDLANTVLKSCWNSFGNGSAMFLRIFVEHMNDERPEVKEKTHKILKEIEKDEIISLTLGEVLSDSLHSLFVSLPRTLSAQDDQGKFQILAHLIGYLQMLGPRLTFTLQSSAHLYRLSSALMQILELDPCEVKVVEEKPPSSVANLTQENIEHTQSRLKNFRSFRDPQILTLLHQVCRLLGYYGDFYLLTDHFLDLYRSQRLPALVVLNQLVLGAAGVQIESFHSDRKNFEPAELVNAVRPILEEYIDPVNWDICTGQGSNEVVDQLADQMASIQIGQKPNLVLRELTNNIWKLCLQLEGISCIAQALGPNFRQLLICSLYPLLEKAGDTSLLVRDTALLALAQVREACGYTDIGHLVEQNADYLASEISLGLRRLQRHEGSAVKVLQVLLDNSSPSLLPMLSDLVQDLLPALDQSQNEGAKMLFPVLNCLVTKIGTWFLLPEVAEEPSLTDPSNESEVPSENMACEMKEFLLDHIQNYRLARGEVEEEDDDVAEMSPPPDEDKEEEKPPMLTHVKICIEVAEKCTHFLSHSNVHIRVQALDTLRLSLLPTRSQRDILLPMAYKAWPSLVKRLTQDEPLVLLRAFEVLVSLTSSCKDFLRHRMCKDAFPAFLTYLRSQALVSCHAGAVYNHMLGYKLQKAILEGLGKLCLDLDLGDNNILEVIDSCMLYLSARQPKKLQEAAIRTFLFLSKLDPDIVWLHLCEWQSPPQPPHFCLVPVPWKAKPNDEYTQNIQLLLKNLQ